MKILNFGSLNIDDCYRVERFASPGETVDSLEFTKNAGGKGLNQSIALARVGADVLHAGCVGRDGDFLKKLLEDNGVNCELVYTYDTPTGHAVIQIGSNGQNSILLFGGANRTIGREHIENALDKLSEGDSVLLQNEINDVSYIIKCAKQRGIRVILNPSPFTGVKDMPLELVDRFIMNEYEASELAGTKNYDELPRKLLEAFPNADFIVTLGSRGAKYISSKKSCFQPIFDSPVVDTTGQATLLQDTCSPKKCTEHR